MTMKLAAYINRFTFGEVSPLLCARGDLTKYGSACKELVNFIPLLQGPVQRRGGTRFIALAGNGAQPVALLDFAFSETTTYILELGDQYLRVFYQGAPVLDADGQPYQIATPWRQEDLFLDSGVCALKWVQSADVMFIVCPGQPPQKLSRYGHTDWRIEELPGWSTEEKSRPNATAIALYRERLCLAAEQTVYMSQSGAFANFEPGQRGMNEVTIVNSSPSSWPLTVDQEAATVRWGGSDSVNVTISFQVGEVDMVRQDNTRVVVTPKEAGGRITRIGFTPSSASDCRVTPNSVAGTISARWSGSSSTVTMSFDALKGSISSDASYDNGYIVSSSDVAVAADDPLEISVYSEQMDRIEWLSPSESLLVGTSGGEFIIGKSTNVDPLGPENVEVIPQTSYGSSPIQALRVGAVLLFVQRAGHRVREFAYDYAGDNYLAMDVTVAAEHITRSGLTCLVWQSEPTETLWAGRSDGQLIGFTYSKDQDMTAWHRHELGGGGRVIHLAVVPAAHGGRDELWLSVQREVNGQIIHSIERMEAGHEYGADLKEAFFVDSGLTVQGSGLTEISGLEHLEGLEVAILGDGAPQHRQTVAGGRVALTWPADVVQIGLPYESRLMTVNMEMQLQDGTAQTRKKRLSKVAFRLLESGGGAAGPDLERLEQFEYRLGRDRMDRAVPLFSGDKIINWPGGWETDGVLTVAQTYPLPFTLAAMVVMVNIDGLN